MEIQCRGYNVARIRPGREARTLGVAIAIGTLLLLLVLFWPYRRRRLITGWVTSEVRSDDPGDRSDRDAWEGAFWDARDPRDVTVHLELDYRDGEGRRTKRRITTRSYDHSLHGGLIIAHCHLRQATRTFRMERVLGAVDTDTGEVVEDLMAHLDAAYARSPKGVREAFFDDHAELLKVLFYVAKADGQFRAQEKAVIRSHLRALIQDPRVHDTAIDRMFEDMAIPTMHVFKVAVGRVLSEQLMPPEALLAACQEIVATQKTSSAGEKEALEYIETRIAQEERSRYGKPA